MLSSWKYCFPSFRTGTHRRRNSSGGSCHQWRLAYAADLNHPSLLEHTPVRSHPLVPSSLAEVRLLQTGTHSRHIPTVMQVIFDWTEAEAARLPCGARLTCGWPCLPQPCYLRANLTQLCRMSSRPTSSKTASCWSTGLAVNC